MAETTSWTDTYLQLSEKGRNRQLEPGEFETLGLAAYLTGRDRECIESLEQAHQAYLDRNMTARAVRSLFWLGLMCIQSGERARASGWFARGERLLGDMECPERGLLLVPQALGNLSKGNATKAQELFSKAERRGEHYGDADLTALGRLGHGESLIELGEVSSGIKLLDEAMIMIESGDVFPVVRGIVYCAVIEACNKVWDLQRAHEWTAALSRWCDANPEMIPFRGSCLVRRAEIIQLHGEWDKALEETTDACSLLSAPPGWSAAGDAFYRKAELHRLFGDFKAAEDAYNEAARHGKNPQPGLALLRLAQGQEEAAETSIRNILSVTKDPKKRADLLPVMVRIMVAAQQAEEAQEAAEELQAIAATFDVPYLNAKASFSQGIVDLAAGNVLAALGHFRDALQLWRTVNLPYETARAREMTGIAYRLLNDPDNANIELSSAKWIYEQLKAKPDLERIGRLMRDSKPKDTYGLTLRELQVLEHIAAGKTNRSIGEDLFISERTVDRHVSNIFNKLGVSSRTEAAALAIKLQLLD